jgi:GNAT superfamily N-acetyltransferase
MIETLTENHLDDILALWKRAGLPIKPKGRDVPERIRDRIEKRTDVFFGIFEGHELAAVILVTHDGRKGWLNRLAVDPSLRGRGMAKELIRHAEAYFKTEGIHIFTALIEEENEVSLQLFQSCGYHLHKDIFYLAKRDYPDV